MRSFLISGTVGRHFVILQFMTAQLADAAGSGQIVEVSCCSCSHVDIASVVAAPPSQIQVENGLLVTSIIYLPILIDKVILKQ